MIREKQLCARVRLSFILILPSEKLISEMNYNVSMGMLNPTHSLITTERRRLKTGSLRRMNCHVEETRNRGRQQKRWMDNVKGDLKS